VKFPAKRGCFRCSMLGLHPWSETEKQVTVLRGRLMPGHGFRIFSREFKEAAVRRILAGEKIRALANELGLRSQLLYTWRDYCEWGGSDALVPRGRPRKAAALARKQALGQTPRSRRPASLRTIYKLKAFPRSARVIPGFIHMSFDRQTHLCYPRGLQVGRRNGRPTAL